MNNRTLDTLVLCASEIKSCARADWDVRICPNVSDEIATSAVRYYFRGTEDQRDREEQLARRVETVNDNKAIYRRLGNGRSIDGSVISVSDLLAVQ